MTAVIRREYLGGTEELTFEEWARSAIQDDQVAIEIALWMLEGDGTHDYNADEPEFYERFEIIDRDGLVAQMEAAS